LQDVVDDSSKKPGNAPVVCRLFGGNHKTRSPQTPETPPIFLARPAAATKGQSAGRVLSAVSGQLRNCGGGTGSAGVPPAEPGIPRDFCFLAPLPPGRRRSRYLPKNRKAGNCYCGMPIALAEGPTPESEAHWGGIPEKGTNILIDD